MRALTLLKRCVKSWNSKAVLQHKSDYHESTRSACSCDIACGSQSLHPVCIASGPILLQIILFPPLVVCVQISSELNLTYHQMSLYTSGVTYSILLILIHLGKHTSVSVTALNSNQLLGFFFFFRTQIQQINTYYLSRLVKTLKEDYCIASPGLFSSFNKVLSLGCRSMLYNLVRLFGWLNSEFNDRT